MDLKTRLLKKSRLLSKINIKKKTCLFFTKVIPFKKTIILYKCLFNILFGL